MGLSCTQGIHFIMTSPFANGSQNSQDANRDTASPGFMRKKAARHEARQSRPLAGEQSIVTRRCFIFASWESEIPTMKTDSKKRIRRTNPRMKSA